MPSAQFARRKKSEIPLRIGEFLGFLQVANIHLPPVVEAKISHRDHFGKTFALLRKYVERNARSCFNQCELIYDWLEIGNVGAHSFTKQNALNILNCPAGS